MCGYCRQRIHSDFRSGLHRVGLSLGSGRGRNPRSAVSRLLAAVAIALLISCGSVPQATEAKPEPILILVSIDGFRWDFRDRGETPHLDRLVAEGVTARKLVPSFPTKTFPNHFTIVTGLYAENHGLVANNIYDPEFDATYGLRKRDEVANARWYDGEPIWVTAETQGLRTAPVFWPGSEAEIRGIRPTVWEPFDGSRPDQARVDAVLELLDRPDGERPAFLTLYFDVLDGVVHTRGPHPSPELQRTVEHVDSMIGRLLAGIEARGLEHRVDLVVVSDHGMSATSRDRVIFVDDYVDLGVANPVAWDPVLGLWPKAERRDEVFASLAGAHPNLTVYRREEMPADLHYSRHRRIPPIVGIADDGWAISTRERFAECTGCFTGGNHGYDHRLESMGALFIAAGPSFKPGVQLESIENIHLYNLMCAVLGLEPAPNDGDPAVVEGLLRDPPS